MQYIKNNKMLFLALCILLGFSIAGIYNNIKEFNMKVNAHEYKLNECKTNMKNESNSFSWCNEYIKHHHNCGGGDNGGVDAHYCTVEATAVFIDNCDGEGERG